MDIQGLDFLMLSNVRETGVRIHVIMCRNRELEGPTPNEPKNHFKELFFQEHFAQ